MNKNNLRLGDWVKIPKLVYDAGDGDFSLGYYQITKLEEDEVWTTGLKELGYDEIEPIPLTSEILEQIGFKEDKQLNLSPDYQYHSNSPDFDILINLSSTSDKDMMIECYNHEKKIKASYICAGAGYGNEKYKRELFVHDLQHIIEDAECQKEIML